MELGKATVRTTGVNLLANALHPGLGVIWTDGRGLFVVPASVSGGQLVSAPRTRLGEFESVQNVHWSGLDESGACYLSVVHPHSVTVWRVVGRLPRPNFKQVRKINIQVLPQGCLWNPSCEVLCLLTRHQCSFYFGHQHQRGSFAFPPLESGRISAGCWSRDGSRLVVCTSAVFLIYTWPDISKSVSDVTPMAWKIPSVSGNITAVVPVSEDSLVCSVEPAPEFFCKSSDSLAASDGKNQRSQQSTASSSLLILDQAPDPGAMSQLVMVRLRGLYQDPVRAASATIPGILSPDLLVFEERSQAVVVGSNSRDRLLLFSCHGELVYMQEIVLGTRERPKGVCGWLAGDGGGSGGLLVVVGDRGPTDEAFPSKTTTMQYNLTLKFFPIRLGVPASAASLPGRQRISSASGGKNARELMRTQSERTVSLGRHRADVSPPPAIAEKDEASLALEREEISAGGDREEALSDAERDTEAAEAYTNADIDDVLDAMCSGDSQPPPVDSSLMNGGPGMSIVRRSDAVKQGSLIEELNSDPSTESKELETERVQFSDVEPVFPNPSPAEFEPGRETVRPSVVVDQVPSLDLNGRVSHSVDSPRSIHSGGSPQSTHSYDSARSARSQGSPRMPRKNSNTPSIRSNSSSLSSHSRGGSQVEGSSGQLKEEGVRITSSDGHRKRDSVSRTGEEEVIGRQTSSHVRQDGPSVPQSLVSGQQPRPAQTDHRNRSDHSRGAGTSPALEGILGAKGDHSCRPSVREERVVTTAAEEEDLSVRDMEDLLHGQEKQIATLQKRVTELSRLVEASSCVFPTHYQEASTPELVHVICQLCDGTSKRRTFVLDQGRVQFEPVRHAFRLSTVELILDGEPCVVGPNIDGYIPMRFKAGSTLHITGLPVTEGSSLNSNH